ncbi:hypothetical protein [Nocardia jejuensis]|uniref:hypothetical protein n=1 Tax=Nocardia jejuensis TaxID=328049 RepID=UPI000A44230C|nr:hypothetical protein [Nocardia jejuensis]
MTATTGARRRISWAATVSVVGAALAVMAVPSASAQGPHISAASTGSSAGSSSEYDHFEISGGVQDYFVGKTYNLNAVMGASNMYDTPTISFYDNGKCLSSTYLVPTGNQFPRFTRMPWVPTTAGSHTLVARSGFASKQLVVTIQSAPAGTTPDPQPTYDACEGLGSGSAG